MGKIFLWLQERIKHGTKPVTSVLIIDTLSDLTRGGTDLVVENPLLRKQLIMLNHQIKRPQLTNLDRFRLVFPDTTINFPIMRGDKTLLVGFTIDITERKQAEQALRESQAKYRALLDSMNEGIIF